MGCGPLRAILGGGVSGIPGRSGCSPTVAILGGSISASETLTMFMPASSFMTDPRSSYDGLVGGTGSGMFVAIPGNGSTPDRCFYATQSDGTSQQGINPQNFDAALATYTMVQVSLAAGLQSETAVGAAFAAAIAAFPEYTVTDLGNGEVEVVGAIDAVAAFTGGDGLGNADAATNRGTSGLWGMRLNTPNTFGSYGSGGVTSCAAQHAVAPALGSTRIVAIDVFVGGVHNAGDQFRLGLYEGGSGVSPVGATLLYDFGQISGTATNSWVRLYVGINDAVEPGNASNLWLMCKSALGVTAVGGVFTASGGQGNLTDQEFFTTSISSDATIAFPATVPVGGGTSGSTFIFAMRLIYQSAPFAADGSWVRAFGVHVAANTVTNAAAIDSQLMMGANPPQALGMRLDWIEMPYAGVHSDAGGQWRLGVYQGGALLNPNTAPLEVDLGQTSGSAINSYVRLTAPVSGDPAEVSISNASVLWWTGKNNNAAGSEIGYGNGGAGGIAAASPDDNPMDWTIPSGVGTGSEYELFATNPTIDPDPTQAFPASVTTDATDTLPGNIPFARIGLRINGIRLVAS